MESSVDVEGGAEEKFLHTFARVHVICTTHKGAVGEKVVHRKIEEQRGGCIARDQQID
jgi:hypothetical protein